MKNKFWLLEITSAGNPHTDWETLDKQHYVFDTFEELSNALDEIYHRQQFLKNNFPQGKKGKSKRLIQKVIDGQKIPVGFIYTLVSKGPFAQVPEWWVQYDRIIILKVSKEVYNIYEGISKEEKEEED